uniref:NTF2 domain-containing protein n=1 Tax=Gouania willdenowi TaxID=441366 RepID=A0A8C5N8S5_GOUWI
IVMEKLSAQVVGRVFVRQYYTVLNKEPENLHRFYGKDSSYVHGGLDSKGKPAGAVYGNLEIQKRVMELSFKDCHTEICHMDAHSMLNEGVVVQVMGELSNNMQPMRRFAQTLVLGEANSFSTTPGALVNGFSVFSFTGHFNSVFFVFTIPCLFSGLKSK